MKNNGKLFGKIHVLDILVILVTIIVLFTGYAKLSGTEIVDFGDGSDVKLRYEVITSGYDPLYFDNLKVGDIIAEDKKLLAGKIISVDIIDKNVAIVDNNGDIISGADPELKRAVVVIEATGEYKLPIYKLGKQELREGRPYFLVTELVNLSSVISQLEIIE